jgi:hypothetical protein
LAGQDNISEASCFSTLAAKIHPLGSALAGSRLDWTVICWTQASPPEELADKYHNVTPTTPFIGPATLPSKRVSTAIPWATLVDKFSTSDQ